MRWEFRSLAIAIILSAASPGWKPCAAQAQSLKKPAVDIKPDELAGLVVDENKQPLAGVHVHVWDWVDSPENQAITGADGRFSIKDCGRNQKVQVRFRKPGYSPVMHLQQMTGVQDLVVTMDSKTYFEGVVFGPDGKPAAGAHIRANQGPKRAKGVTITTVWTDTKSDPAGHYRLYVEPDSYELLVKSPGVGVTRLQKTPILHGEKRSFDIKLQPGITFQALVTDAETGDPVPNARLWHWRHKDVEGRADEKGKIAIKEMLPGSFEFQVDAPGYARWWSQDAGKEWNRFQVREDSIWQRNFDYLDFDIAPNKAPVNIVLEKGVRITGRVLDPEGKPVGGATVAPALTSKGSSLTGDSRFSFESKPDGSFEMLLPASGLAEYNLIAHDGKIREWRHWANGVLPPIRTKPGQELKNVTIKLTRPATVRGKVIDAEGKPVTHREVYANAIDKRENNYYEPTATTKEDGTFELRFIRPGAHFIEAAPSWFFVEGAPPQKTLSFRLAEGQVLDATKPTNAERK